MEGVKGRLWKVKNKQRQHRETSKRGPRAELVGVDGDSVTPSSNEPPAYNRPWFLFLFAFLFINRRIFAIFFFKICEILIKSGLFVTGCVADFQNAEESGFCLVLLCVDEAEDIKRRAQMA